MSKALRLTPHAAPQISFSCPVCEGTQPHYIFSTRAFRAYRCSGCALTFSQRAARSIGDEEPTGASSPRVEKDHATLIETLGRLSIVEPVLVLSDTDDEIIRLLARLGISSTRVFDADSFEGLPAGRTFNLAIISDVIMRVANPRTTLEKLRSRLADGAHLVLSIPLLDGRQAKLMGRNWHEWNASNWWFYTRETLSLLLMAAGFEHIWFHAVRRIYSFNQLVERMRHAHEGTRWFGLLDALRRLFPTRLSRSKFPLPSGSSVVTASAAKASSETVISIVVPVFNERATFKEMFDALLAKQLPGLRKEIIVVESNSTDGSQELVRAYQNHPDVRLIFQPAPQGKGNAVREGLAAATGDVVLIQDADLEYDLDDYDDLLEPLLCLSLHVRARVTPSGRLEDAQVRRRSVDRDDVQHGPLRILAR